MKKRLLSLLLVWAMGCAMLPTALAAEPHRHEDGSSFAKALSCDGQGNLLIDGGTKGVWRDNYTRLDDSVVPYQGIGKGTYYLSENITLNTRLCVYGDSVRLCLNGKTLTVTGVDDSDKILSESCTDFQLADCQPAGGDREEEHTHSWRYTADDAVIRAECTASGCTDKNGGSVTLCAPAHTVYGDGKSADAVILPDADWKAESVDAMRITYAGSEQAPTHAGTYTAYLTLGEATASVRYTIDKAVPTAADFTFTAPKNLRYDGTAKTVSVESAVTDGAVSVKYERDGTEKPPVDAGTYTVKIDVSEGTDYHAAAGLTDDGWRFTILPDRYAAAVSMQDYTYGTAVPVPRVENNRSGGSVTFYYRRADRADSAEWKDITPTALDAGTYYMYAVIEAAGNYDRVQTDEILFTVKRKSLSDAEIVLDSTPLVYNGSEQQPEVREVTLNGAELVQNRDYTVAYGNNRNAGTAAYAEITGTGNYEDTAKRLFAIAQAKPVCTAPQNRTAVYGDSLNAVALVNPDGNTAGVWHWQVAESTSVGDAGTHSFPAAFVPADSMNYQTVENIPVEVTVRRAAGRQLGTENRQQRYTDTAAHTVTPDWTQLPSGQSWRYAPEWSGTADTPTVAEDGTLTYRITDGRAGDCITFTVKALCENYEAHTYTVRVTLLDREAQSGFGFADGLTALTKTYGDAAFVVRTTGAADSSAVTYASSAPEVAAVDPQTGEVTISGAGTAVITATAGATEDYAEAKASFALTVEKKPIEIPAADSTAFVYSGKEQTYGIAETADYRVDGGKRTEAGAQTVTVTLRDTKNTRWTDRDAESITYPFTIEKAVLTVTAKSRTVYAGDKVPAAEYTVSGLADGDTLHTEPVLRYVPEPDLTRPGTAVIKADGADAGGNYTIRYIDGSLTILARPASGGSGGSGGGSSAPRHTVSAPSGITGGTVKSNASSAAVGSTVTVTAVPQTGYRLEKLVVTDDKGNVLRLTDKGDGRYSFTMPSGKVTIAPLFAAIEPEPRSNPFRDVSERDYFSGAVQWAAERNITGGVSSDRFAPDEGCTRAQIVTFLWRAAGSPEPEGTLGFADVAAEAYYAKAAAWASEQGIAVGTSAGAFGPDDLCTRAQSAAFLYRAAGANAAEEQTAFDDVDANAYYAAAVQWAVGQGITNGISSTQFAPDSVCTRAQIVTFLYRLYGGT